MAAKVNKNLVLMCHPYLFALKEGKDFTQNYLDYSLLLMQRNCSEVIKSPAVKMKGVTATHLVTPHGERLAVPSP